MDKEDKRINYFLVNALILKNGQQEIIEEHGLISKEFTPQSLFDRLSDSIKRSRATSNPGDRYEVVIQSWDKIDRALYEAKFGE